MSQDNTIESLIRRKGGTVVEFGTPGLSSYARYHFKPEAEDGPHLCEVDNDEHYAQFLSIREGFRRYRRDAAPVQALTANQSAPAFAPKDPYADLVAVDPGTVSNEWLHGFARQVLSIQPKNRQALEAKLLSGYGIQAEQRHTATDIIRLILSEMIKEQSLAARVNASGLQEPPADAQDDAPTGEDSSQ